MKLSDLANAVGIAMAILNHRLLTLLALFMTFGLFCWAMYMGDLVRLFTAGAFGVAIFLPVLLGEKRPEVPQDEKA